MPMLPAGALSLCLMRRGAITPAFAKAPEVNVDEILDDPAAPVGGNPKGDVPIVAFLDYNCPYCRKTAPDLQRFVTTDGNVRLVYKDWPILAVSSVFGARIALAAKYQGKYQAAHDALMAIQGPSTTERAMRDAVGAAGVDMDRVETDLAAHYKIIGDLLKRNNSEAKIAGTAGNARLSDRPVPGRSSAGL